MAKLTSYSASRIFARRSFMRSAAYAAAAPALNFLVGPANASNWRGLVGCVKPTVNSSSLVEMIRLLPLGIGIVPVYLNFTEGTRQEMQNSYANYEKNVAYLASQHCDTISIEGAPPFMILGPDGEAKFVDGWRQKYKTDMFTSSQNQVNVLRAMKIKKILGITPFGPDLNKSYAKYFEDCSIGVVAMEGMDVSFRSIPDVPSEVIYSFIKRISSTQMRMPFTSWRRTWTRSVSLRRLNRILVFGSCNRSRRASGKFNGACMFISQSKAMAVCWRPCRHRASSLAKTSSHSF
jgi:maleate isomerase